MTAQPSNQPARDVTSEMLVTLPLSHGFSYAGLVDAIEDGVLIDDKSTGDPESYARDLPLRRQADCYALAAIAAGHEITDVRYRIVARPKLSMKAAPACKLTQNAEPKPTIKKRKSETHDAFAERLAKWHEDNPPETNEQFAARVAAWEADHPAETEAEFEERCFAWLTEGEGRLLDVAIHLNPDRLEGARKWLDGRCNIARYLRATPEVAHKNASACSRHGRQCEYADLCLAQINGGDPEDIIAARWPNAPASTPHPELPEPYRSADNVLTFSALSVMDDCEQRFVWRYLRGLRRDADESEPEALRVGSLYHKGREVYRNTGDVNAALAAIDYMGDDAPPAFADEQRKQREQVVKARAMLRASTIKWPVANQWAETQRIADALADDIRVHAEVPLSVILDRVRALTQRLDRVAACYGLTADNPASPFITTNDQPADAPPADLPF